MTTGMIQVSIANLSPSLSRSVVAISLFSLYNAIVLNWSLGNNADDAKQWRAKV